MIKSFIRKNGIECYENASLKMYNSYRLNVKCKYLVFPKNIDELSKLVKHLRESKYKFLVLGNGSNIIFSSVYYDGVIIKLDCFNKIVVNDNIVEVGAGYSLIKLSLDTAFAGLSGLEFASAIPGNIGASVAMNAGAYKHSLSEIVESVVVLNPNYEIVTMTNGEMNFRYRDSFFKENRDYIILSCKLRLVHGDRREMLKLISKRRIRRIEAQPLNYPSAGSVFRNPEGMYAGELIEKCGLKGYAIGGAMISKKHANFVVNYNNATGEDIINLINKVKEEVLKKYNIKLVMEQIIID